MNGQAYSVECPACCNADGFIEGERMHVDCGHYVQIDPDHCELCGYVQSNGTDEFPGNYELVKKCWELQVEQSK